MLLHSGSKIDRGGEDMKKMIIFSMTLALFSVFMPQVAQAQPAAAGTPANKDKAAPATTTQPAPAGKPAPGAKPAAAAKPAQPAVPVPVWQSSPPKVIGKIELRYDINRDGILQTAEIKILLRDALDDVKTKGFFNIGDSDLAKTYDKNKDGIIDNLEAETIKADIGNK